MLIIAVEGYYWVLEEGNLYRTVETEEAAAWLREILATRTRVDVELITGDLAQVEISRIGMSKIKP